MAIKEPKRAPVVLAVDDGNHNLDPLQQALVEGAAWRTLLAFSAKEALATLQAVIVDVVVLEHDMPQLTGVELLERAAYLGRCPASILCTSRPDAIEVREAQARGLVQRVLKKPWSKDDLLLAVSELIAERPTRP